MGKRGSGAFAQLLKGPLFLTPLLVSFLNPSLLHHLHYLMLLPSLIAQIFADEFIDVVVQVHLTVLLVLATL